MEFTIKLSDYSKALRTSNKVDSEYPYLIRCIKDSKYGRYKKGDFFVAKLENFGHDPETTSSDLFDRYYFSTKPVFFASQWMFVEDVEIIANINEK